MIFASSVSDNQTVFHDDLVTGLDAGFLCGKVVDDGAVPDHITDSDLA
jgi:hypothetical protein